MRALISRQLVRLAGAVMPKRKAAPLPDNMTAELARILRPQAAYRWLLPQLAAITPQYIEMTLRGALAGNHVQAWELFDLMEDTWPRLLKNEHAVKRAVQNMLLTVDPYQDEDAAATDSASQKQRLVWAALRNWRPDPAADENGFDGTVFDILDAWFKGQTVLEVDWQQRQTAALGSFIAPKSTFWVHPTCYAWSMEGRLGLRLELTKPSNKAGAPGYTLSPGVWQSTTMQPLPSAIDEFPANKFLICVCRARSGTALAGALLRPLAWWWCAANFSADWLLNLAQIFGLPFRWANYDRNAPQSTIDSICNMLQNMGSAAWGAFPEGTQIEFKEAGKTGDQSPQGDLLDRADRNCDLLILGQTLTSQMDSSGGSRAAAQVHADVKDQITLSAAKFVCEVFNNQLIPSILQLNYGEDSESPIVKLNTATEDDLENEATIIQTLTTAGFGSRIGLDWLGKKFNIPKPEEGEETLGAKAQAAIPGGDPEPGPNSDPNAVEATDTEDEDPESPLASGDVPGHPFRGNQHTSGEGGGEIRESRVTLHAAAEQKLGIEHGHVFADHAALAKKHPEYFRNSQEAKAYVDHVASRPTHVLPGNQPDHAMIVRRDQENRAFAMDVVKRGGKYRVRSAHTLREEQFQKRLKAAGPGATLGVSRVDSPGKSGPHQAKTPSRSLRASHGAPPAATQNILDRVAAVNPPTQISDSFDASSRVHLAGALRADLAPALHRLSAIQQIQDPVVFQTKIKAFLDDQGALADIVMDPESARAIADVIATAMANTLSKTGGGTSATTEERQNG